MATEISERGRQAAAISNAIARLHREHYGRGATTTRTIIQRNFVVCFLEDIYTPVERTLIESDRRDAVRGTRNIFQDAMSAKFTEAVEAATGRNVIAFMSQVTFDPDMAAEVFVLEPDAEDRPRRAEPNRRPSPRDAGVTDVQFLKGVIDHRGLEAAGFEGVSVQFTHEVADGMHGAIVKAVKTHEPEKKGLPVIQPAAKAGCC